MMKKKITPKHLDTSCFIKLIEELKDTRIKDKHSKKDITNNIPIDNEKN